MNSLKEKQEALNKEIVDYFTKIQHGKVVVYFNQNKSCTVHLSKMYEGLGDWVSFKNLKWLSDKLGTEKIDLQNQYYEGGCESCDWGSEQSVDIVCREIDLND